MDGLPVTVRLLDPPLHEFLPSVEELEIKEATDGPRRRGGASCSTRPRSWHEFNPMLGTRGVRLGVVKPGLYAMQVRALMEAAAELRGEGRQADRRDHDPAHRHPRGAGTWPARGSRTRSPRRPKGVKKKPKVTIGTMIETPRAAIRADEIAEEADFFCFGTNDLTQMTFGFSRDDVESRMMPAYLEQGLLKRNPFETIDRPASASSCASAPSGAGRRSPTSSSACAASTAAIPSRSRSSTTPASTTCRCSPFRVPIARLAAAQAVLGTGG